MKSRFRLDLDVTGLASYLPNEAFHMGLMLNYIRNDGSKTLIKVCPDRRVSNRVCYPASELLLT